jgi:hypothetical protein
MAIKNNNEYIRINPDKIFSSNGYIPVLVYRSEEDRSKEKAGAVLTGISMPRPRLINLKFKGDLTATEDKTIIQNMITEMYEQLKSEKIKKTVITYEDTEPYKDYLDC